MSNPKKDYYGILGVDKNADESTIKKTYYKLAKKYHPDSNPDNKKESETKFKEIIEAYGVLSDPNKRQQYDQFGVCDGDAPDFAQGFPDISEIFRSMGVGGMVNLDDDNNGFPGIGNMFGMRQQREKKQTQKVTIEIKLSEIYNGTTKNIEIPVNDMCKGCNGTGSKNKIKETCKSCQGRGIKTILRQLGPGMIQQMQTQCDVCNGKGNILNPKDVCQVCNGKCTILTKLNKTINISKSFDYETVMILKNSGNYDSDLNTKVDINIVFKICDLDKYNFKIQNKYDLFYEYPININDALTGYSMYWNLHPNGNKYNFKINDVIKDGDIKFIKNLGLPFNNKKGKLYIKFNYIYPKSILDNETLKIFIKTKDTKNITDKETWSKEKIYDIKDDLHNNNSNNNNSHNNEDGPQQCAQS